MLLISNVSTSVLIIQLLQRYNYGFQLICYIVAIGNGSVDSNTTLPGLSVPTDVEHGRAAIQAVIFEIAGPINTPLIETWWWSVNISDTTSEELVYSSYAGENSRVCQIPMEG